MDRHLFRYEHRREAVLPPSLFYQRMVRSTLVGTTIVVVSLAIGMAGYMGLEGQGWLDAFLSASMILGGMGPVAPVVTPAGKLFAGLYALYSGLILIFTAGILLAPLAHRLLHRFHVETDEDEDRKRRAEKS